MGRIRFQATHSSLRCLIAFDNGLYLDHKSFRLLSYLFLNHMLGSGQSANKHMYSFRPFFCLANICVKYTVTRFFEPQSFTNELLQNIRPSLFREIKDFANKKLRIRLNFSVMYGIVNICTVTYLIQCNIIYVTSILYQSLY